MKLRVVISTAFILAFFVSFAQENNHQRTASSEKGLLKITVMYPFSEGKTFDMTYYETKHMPMVADIIGANLVKYTIEKGLASGIPNQPLSYMAIGTFYVRNLQEYQSAIAPHRETIRTDITKYTNVAPVILISEVVR
ncbi:EthD family reductase [Pseudochryseolinea flava]|uniref:EthD family reductase n=1 Tax=Pseudochryseolinea flava TaxID=2059302 RepID=A0A364Y5N7_9BACT|nr:EthD family reductase [Pseudochryseolinea flava]RAW02115.1 EthD family reductase [Pseudochryseolinea flava]